MKTSFCRYDEEVKMDHQEAVMDDRDTNCVFTVDGPLQSLYFTDASGDIIQIRIRPALREKLVELLKEEERVKREEAKKKRKEAAKKAAAVRKANKEEKERKELERLKKKYERK